MAQLQREATAEACEAATAATAAATAERSTGGKHAQPPPPPPRAAAGAQRSPRSPRRDLHFEQEQLWPSLGAAVAAAAHHSHGHHGGQQQQQQQQQQHALGARQPPQPGEARRALPLLPPLAPILPSVPTEQEASSSSGSADTAATTPQSPVSSVVAFCAAPPPAKAAVAGRCAVVLQRGGSGLGAEPDPEGASLAASLQEAVRAGSLSVKQAAASLASYLRQRQAAAVAAGSASSSPGSGACQLSCGGCCGTAGGLLGYSPFSLPGAVGLAGVGPSLAACDSRVTSVSLSHWASSGTSITSSLSLHGSQPALALYASGAASWQQQSPLAAEPTAGSPRRDSDKLPLFMRRGSLPAVAAVDSAGGGSGMQEAKHLLRPPPGFTAQPNGIRS